MARPIAFGWLVHATIRECTDECRARIANYKAGDTLNPADFEYFEQLFTRHPDRKKKVGVGIKQIKYDADGYGNNCLWVVRHDNSTEHISWRKCLRPLNREEMVEAAFKRAVASSVSRASIEKNEGAYLASKKFKRLLKNFLATHEVSYDDIQLKKSTDKDDPRPRLTDSWLATKWFVFYKENAQLLT